MKMEAICSSETSGDSLWTTRHYIAKEGAQTKNRDPAENLGASNLAAI
jgi:hypothetical protein